MTRIYYPKFREMEIIKMNKTELLEVINSSEDNEKFIEEFLVSEIYKNKGNQKESLKYGKLAQEHLDLYIKETSNI